MTSDQDIIDQIERVRSYNNVNWMEILRIAMKADPVSTKKVLSKVLIADLEVSRLTRSLADDDRKPKDSA